MSDGSDAETDAEADHDEGRTDVAIRDSIHERVADRVDQSDFESTAHYIEFTMEEVLARVEGDRSMEDAAASDPLDDGDDGAGDEVESRLESLGYM